LIAVDSSTLIAFIQGAPGTDVDQFDRSLAAGDIAIPPVVLTEVLSDQALPVQHRAFILRLPRIEVSGGYWVRAASTRALLVGNRLRARLADTLIAQSCIDTELPLITRDKDFRHFVRHGLRLM
jgi:predicted nucleic acid-binding protein